MATAKAQVGVTRVSRRGVSSSGTSHRLRAAARSSSAQDLKGQDIH